MIADDVGERILDLIREGRSCRAVARATGVAASTVSRRAAAAGLSFDREQTAKAVVAVRVDAAVRRAEVGAALLEDIDVARLGRLTAAQDAREFANIAQGVAALARAYKDLAVLPGSPENDGAEEVKIALAGFLALAAVVNVERHPPGDEVW